MPKPKLTARKAETVKEPGMHPDGTVQGLYLRVTPTGARSWILRTVVHGRRRDLGLGSASLVSLAEAQETARRLRKIAREGGDPTAERRKETLTFEEAARRVHAQLLPTWKNAKHAETWLSSVETYANPVFGKRPIETVGTADVDLPGKSGEHQLREQEVFHVTRSEGDAGVSAGGGSSGADERADAAGGCG